MPHHTPCELEHLVVLRAHGKRRKSPGGSTIHRHRAGGILPVTAAEMQLKLDKGIDGMLEHIEQVDEDIYGPIDPSRRSTV